MSVVEANPRPSTYRATSQAQTDLIATLAPMNGRQKFFLGCFAAVFLWGLAAFIYQLCIGLAATAMNNYFSWGVYIINFVFFIGISHAGMLVSAILRVAGASWRRPIARMAEGLTIFALMIGAPMIIVDMGRPDRILNLLFHFRFQSPILWDVLSVTTYITGSLLYLYMTMIPDMAILRDCSANFAPWRRWLYRTLSLGWTGTADQQYRLQRAIGAMAIVIIPVAISVHTVVSWIFGMTLRTGWHSTIFGPYFVVGALFSGIAALLVAMQVFVWYFKPCHLDRYITLDVFKKLASLLLACNLVYIYFTFSEYMTMGFPGAGAEQKLLDSLFTGSYAWAFWSMAVIGLIIPAILLSLPKTRTIKGIVTACVMINIGMWIKRYVVIVPTLASPFLPIFSPGNKPVGYVPTWVEWSITAGGFAGFCMLYLLFAKVFPIVSIWEMKEVENENRPAPVEEPGDEEPVGSRKVALVASVLMAAAVVLGFSGRTSAQAMPTANLSLKIVTVDDQKLLRAELTGSDGKPVPNATVQFFVKRTFGDIKLGEDKTLADGTASAGYPTGLPGGYTGELSFRARVTAPDPCIAANATLVDDGGRVVVPVADPFPRALWSPHAPLPLLIVLACLVGGVWATYAFAVAQIIAIKKGGV